MKKTYVALSQVALLTLLSAQAAYSSQLNPEASYQCSGLHSSSSFNIQINESSAEKDHKNYSMNLEQSKANHQMVYGSEDEQIFVDKNLATFDDGTGSVQGQDGDIRLSDGSNYFCRFTIVNQYANGIIPIAFATSSGNIELTTNLPAKIKTGTITVTQKVQGKSLSVNVPHPYVSLSPGGTLQVPLLNGSGTYVITLSDQDQSDIFAIIRVTNRNSTVLRYVQPSQTVQSDSPEIFSLAQSITAGMTTDREKIIAVHDWMAKNIVYNLKEDGSANLNADTSNSLVVLHNRTGVCFGFAALNAALLRSLSIPTQFILGTKLNHAWNEVLLDGRWYLDDTTWDAFAYYKWDKNRWVRTGILNPDRQYINLGFMSQFDPSHTPGYATNL